MSDLTAWWATSEPAPKAIPETIVPMNPENIPPLWAGAWTGAGWRTGAGYARAGDERVGELLREDPRAIKLLDYFIKLS